MEIESPEGTTPKKKLGPFSSFAFKCSVLSLVVLAYFSLRNLTGTFIILMLPFALNIGAFKGQQKKSFLLLSIYANYLGIFLWLGLALVGLITKKFDDGYYFYFFVFFSLFCSFICWLSARQIKANYLN